MQYFYNLLFCLVSYASNSQSVWKLFFFPQLLFNKNFPQKNNNKQNLVTQRD